MAKTAVHVEGYGFVLTKQLSSNAVPSDEDIIEYLEIECIRNNEERHAALVACWLAQKQGRGPLIIH